MTQQTEKPSEWATMLQRAASHGEAYSANGDVCVRRDYDRRSQDGFRYNWFIKGQRRSYADARIHLNRTAEASHV